MKIRFGLSVACLIMTGAVCRGLDVNADPPLETSFFAAGMGLPQRDLEKVFRPETNQAGFTAFEGVNDVRVKNGNLVFTLSQVKGILGWGNYAGQQPIPDVSALCRCQMIPVLKVRQGQGESAWRARLWRDGQAITDFVKAELKGDGQWHELKFPELRAFDQGHENGADPDGLEFEIRGTPKAGLEIEWFKAIQPVFEGYCRTEFVLPDEPVWRAIADVASRNDLLQSGFMPISERLYLNGRVVPRRGSELHGHCDPVDIAPYLQPGTNCVGFYGYGIRTLPQLFFQGAVIMESGAVIPVKSRPRAWKYSPAAPAGWNRPGFDDTAWQPVRPSGESIGAAHWTPIYVTAKQLEDAGVGFEIDTHIFHEGRQSLKISSPRATIPISIAHKQQDVQTGGVYELSAWFRSEPAGLPARLQLSVRADLPDHKSYTGETAFFNASNEWTHQAVTFTMPKQVWWAQPVIHVRQRDGKPIAGQVWIDDVRFTRKDVPEPAAQALVNGDFELPADAGEVPLDLKTRMPGKSVMLPGYKGRLVLENPKGRYLYYHDDAPVVVDVCVPRGLGRHSPILAWMLGRVKDDGSATAVDQGQTPAFYERDLSLVYRLDLGQREHGVYVIALSLSDAAGALIEERAREPLVVLRRLPQKTVRGETFTEGLDLELEDTLDFTNPNDPHPWHESIAPPHERVGTAQKVDQPVIIRKDGRGGTTLVYREAANRRRGSGFSYRIEFKHPGAFYYLELEYPDDARRTVDVIISSKAQGGRIWTNSQVGLGYETGGRFLPTGRLLSLCWLHVADPGPHSVDLVNLIDGQKAAAKSLKIYRVRGLLPSVGAGAERRFGIHTERDTLTSGLSLNFGGGNFEASITGKGDDDQPLMQRRLKDLVWMKDTAERYIQYLKFAGQNCRVMGNYQYNNENTVFLRANPGDGSRIPGEIRMMLAELFELHAIDWFAGVEYSQCTDDGTFVNNAQAAQGSNTVWMINGAGQQRYGLRYSTMPSNWLHPVARRSFRDLIQDLAATYGHLPRFRGVHNFITPSMGVGYNYPGFGNRNNYADPLDCSFDDITWKQFTRDTGLAAESAPADVQRFAKRKALLLENPKARERFLAWRGEQFGNFLADAVEVLRTRRADLQFVNVVPVEESEFYQYLVQAGKDFKSLLAEFAIDLDRLGREEGLATGRWTVSWRDLYGRTPYPSQDPFCWLARTDPAITAAFPGRDIRYVFARSSWDENFFWSGGHTRTDGRALTDRLLEGSDWIMGCQRTRAHPQPAGVHAREAFIQAMVTADANLLIGGFCDMQLNLGNEQILRSVLKPWSYLPPDQFEAVLGTGLKSNLAIRKLRKGYDTWFYVVNPTQWPMQGSLTLQTQGNILELVSGEMVLEGRPKGTVKLPIMLEPFGLAAYRSHAPVDLAITAYEARPATKGDLEPLADLIQTLDALLADPAVSHGIADVDPQFMKDALTKARKQIDQDQVAAAWALLTDSRVWAPYQKMEALTALSDVGQFLVDGWQVSKVMPKTGNVTNAPAVKLADDLGWQAWAADDPASGRLSVHTLYGNQDGIVYLGNTVRIHHPCRVEALLGHDGGAKLFVDGREMACDPVTRPPITPDRTRAVVDFAPGTHEIMVALDLAAGKGYGIRFRFGSEKGQMIRVADYPRAIAVSQAKETKAK